MEEGLLKNKCRETIDQTLNKWFGDLLVVSHRADSSVIARHYHEYLNAASPLMQRYGCRQCKEKYSEP